MSHASEPYDSLSPAFHSDLINWIVHYHRATAIRPHLSDLSDNLDVPDRAFRRGETLLVLIQDPSLSAQDRVTAVTELGIRVETALTVASYLECERQASVRLLGNDVSLNYLSVPALQAFQSDWWRYFGLMRDLVPMMTTVRGRFQTLQRRVETEERTGAPAARGIELTDVGWEEFWEIVRDVRVYRRRIEGVLTGARTRREQVGSDNVLESVE